MPERDVDVSPAEPKFIQGRGLAVRLTNSFFNPGAERVYGIYGDQRAAAACRDRVPVGGTTPYPGFAPPG